MPVKKRISQGQKSFNVEMNKAYNFNIYDALEVEVTEDDDIQASSESIVKEQQLESECDTTTGSDHKLENGMTSDSKVEGSDSDILIIEEPGIKVPLSEHEMAHEKLCDHLDSKSYDENVGLELKPTSSHGGSSHVTASLSELIGPDDVDDESEYEDPVENPVLSMLKRFIESDSPTEPTCNELSDVACHRPSEGVDGSHLQSASQQIQSSDVEAEPFVLTAPQELPQPGNSLGPMEKLWISPSIIVEPTENRFLVRDVEACDNVEDQPLTLNTKVEPELDGSIILKKKLWINPGVIIEPTENEFLAQDVETFVNSADQPLALVTKPDLVIDKSMISTERLWISPGIIIEHTENEFLAQGVVACVDVKYQPLVPYTKSELEIDLCTDANGQDTSELRDVLLEGEESEKRSDLTKIVEMNINLKLEEQSLPELIRSQSDEMGQREACLIENFDISRQENSNMERDDEELSCSDSSHIEYSSILSEPIPSDTPTTIRTVSIASAQYVECAKRSSTPPNMSRTNGQSANATSHNNESVYGAAAKFCFMSVIIFGLKTLAYVLLGLADRLAADDSHQSKLAIVRGPSSDRDEILADVKTTTNLGFIKRKFERDLFQGGHVVRPNLRGESLESYHA
ncbi:MAG: hypothetical protein LQ342_006469 [Letrouitia transgressa]|nr:MAG: hypothetical protein LQ342_006469 [Letrouitia transgressa]